MHRKPIKRGRQTDRQPQIDKQIQKKNLKEKKKTRNTNEKEKNMNEREKKNKRK